MPPQRYSAAAFLSFVCMPGINEMIKRVVKIDFDKATRESIEKTPNEFTRIQKEQMQAGLRADGKIIGKYKNPVYARKKLAMNPMGKGRMDWRLTGELYSEIFIDVRRYSVVVFSANEKTLKLVEQFGDPFGLYTPYAKEYSNQFLKPEAIKNIIKQITG